MRRGEQHALVEQALADQVSRHAGSGVRIMCPICPTKTGKDDLRKSLVVRDDRSYTCFKCGAWGHLDGYEATEPRDLPARPDSWSLPPEFESLAGAEDSYVLGRYARYLRERVSPHLWADIGVGVCRTGRYGGRIIVPVRDNNRELQGWVAREVPGITPACLEGVKYLTPAGFNRNVMFGSQNVPLSDAPILLVEGAFDAMPHWPDALACLGKPTNPQIDRIVATSRPIVVCLDGDARDEGEAVWRRLRLRGVTAGYIRLPHGVDPGVIGPEQMQEFMSIAMQRPESPAHIAFAD